MEMDKSTMTVSDAVPDGNRRFVGLKPEPFCLRTISRSFWLLLILVYKARTMFN